VVDATLVLKLYRRLQGGLNPEIEIGRFLTEVAGYHNTPPLLGSVELIEGDKRFAIAIVHAFVENQGDAWSLTAAYLNRFLHEHTPLVDEAPTDSAEHAAYLPRMQQIGRRTAEMQLAFLRGEGDPAFAPEPIERNDLAKWTSGLLDQAGLLFEQLARRLASL